jgi:hypothetical protein
MRRPYVIASLLLVIAILVATWAAQRGPKPVELIPTLTDKPEYCLTCHADLPEISPAHPINAFGCIICHGGEALALDADLAHSTMRGGRNPADLLVVEANCGGTDCHSGPVEKQRDHIHRVMTSIQSTYAGAIANIRYSFGAQPDLTARLGIYGIQDDSITTITGVSSLAAFDPEGETSPSVLAFSANCLNCHLSATPLEGIEFARLTGCAACHTPTAGTDLEQPVHLLTTAIPYTQCNTCHNRGNYDLRSISFVHRRDQPTNRFEDYYQPIAQFVRCEWTLDCIDCHTRIEAMGNGDIQSSKKDIQYIQCSTCHGTIETLPQTRRVLGLDDLAMKLAFLNRQADAEWDLLPGETILVTSQGEPLWNTRLLSDGTYQLFGKATGEIFSFRAVKGTACQQKIDEQSSQYCHVCHQETR